MALTERQQLGKIEILADGQIQIRTDTIVERDGTEIARTYHRRVLEPGADVAREPARLRAVATVVWTPEVIEARREFLRQQAAEFPTPTRTRTR